MSRRRYEEEDEWVERGYHRGYSHVAPPPPPPPANYLVPEVSYGSSLRRSRSTGQAPQPHINIYQRNDYSPPRGRRNETELVDAIDNVAHEIRRGRSRTPSAYREPSPGYYQTMQMELVRRRWDEDARSREQAEIRRLQERLEDDETRWREGDRVKTQIELDRLREEIRIRNAELRHNEERDRILSQRDKEEREAEDERKRIKMELELKEREEQEEKKRIVTEYSAKEAAKKQHEREAAELAVAEFEKKKQDEKKKREALVAQIKLEEMEKKRKEDQLEEEWRLKLAKKEEDKKKKQKEKEEELEEEMRKRLSKFGFQNNQIEAMIDPKKADALKPGQSPAKPATAALVPFVSKNPTYVKVHRDHIDIQTLHYFGLPWEYDAADSNYIIILQEMETRETDILFEHTRKLRRGGTQLLIEEHRGRRGQPEYAFVRRRKPSASPVGRRRSSPKSVLRLW